MQACRCKECIKLCWCSPGWFGDIKEVEGSSKLLGLPVKTFCREYLIREWRIGLEGVYVPAPRRNFRRANLTTDNTPLSILREGVKNHKGFLIASYSYNFITDVPCIFLTSNKKCYIHNTKPKECREAFGCNKEEDSDRREQIVRYWNEHQDFIRWVLEEKRKPEGKGGNRTCQTM